MLYTGGFFKNLQTSDTNGHFSEYVATRRTFSVSHKTVPLLLDADGTPTSFPGSLFFLGTRLIECLSRDRGLEQTCLWPILRKWSRHASGHNQQSHKHSSKRVSVAREFLFCYHFLTKVLLVETSGPWYSILESISDLAFVALAVSDSILLQCENNKSGVREPKKHTLHTPRNKCSRFRIMEWLL